jgi:ABC-type glycerol-3-phosphate transport system permease component
MMIWNMGQQGSLFADGHYHFVLLLAGIVALPPILLFIIFRKWLVSEVLVGSLLKR